MDNKNVNMRPSQPKQQDPIEMIKKYTKLLWSKKLWIVLITFIVSVIWYFISPMVIKPPEFTSTVIIKFDDPRFSRNIGGVTDFAQEQTEGKVALLYTNSLLEKVVDSLELNVRVNTKGIKRFSFFKKIEIENNAEFGKYDLVYNKELSKISVFYTNNQKEVKDKFLKSQYFSTDSIVVIQANGLTFYLNPTEFIQNNKIEINYIPKRFIVEGLKQKISSNLDRSRTLLTVGYDDKDPEVSAAVINTVANLFVDKLLDYKRYRTTSVLKSFEEQLVLAQNELEISENRVRQFRERNPFLMLSRDGSNIVTQLSNQQGELSTIEQSIERIKYLIQNKNNLTGDNRNAAYQEILSVISARDLTGSQVLVDQYSRLVAERNRLISENYTEDHMLVQDVSLRLKNMQNEIDTRVSQFLDQIEIQKNKLQNTVNNNEDNIRRLPGNEIKLAELERDRQVKANIYSSILERYNEAKVSDTAVIPDAFIIENAEIPIAYSGNIIDKLIKLLIGPFLGLFLAIGLFIALDLLDKSVKESAEVEIKLSLPVLATIPVILGDNEIPDEIENQRHIESKLITSSYAPSIANEGFRLLRTKLFMHEKQNKSLIISSLEPGDGKSLIAANISITFAQQKISTLLLDCDLRRGVLHNSFKCNKKPGLTDVLVRNTTITNSEISNVIQNTHVPNLFMISSGIQVPNPSELLGGIRMQQVLELLQKKFSMIIMDTPPIGFIPDALVLNSIIHNILFVVRYGKTNLNKVSDKIAEYSSIKEDFKGVIINASAEAGNEKYHTYSYYHY
jgi:capsular exopolysaccharide synthesis family protein